MLERDIEDYLVTRVKARGGEVRKVKWIGRNGAPDRRVMLPGRCVWVEVKAPGKDAEPHQRREHDRMRRMGEDVVVVNSLKGVDAL